LQELAEGRADSLTDLQKAERDGRGSRSKVTYGRGGDGGPRKGYLDDVGSGVGGKGKMVRPEDQGGQGLKWKGGKRFFFFDVVMSREILFFVGRA